MATQLAEAPDPYKLPLDQFDVHNADLFQRDLQWGYFKRLREEDPVHYCSDSPVGPYWSVTKYKDIMEVDSNHKIFSSINAIALEMERFVGTTDDATSVGGFIAMDQPKHDEQRKAVSPAVAPTNIALLEGLMRERTRDVLNSLPIGEEFDWVSTVSIELTTLMLATLVDYPLEQRQDLKYWSDVVSGQPGDGFIESWEHRDAELKKMAAVFMQLREERRAQPPKNDLISMLAHSPMAQGMTAAEYVSNVTLLIVGGNDTTRNTMSGSILAFHDNPDQWAKLMANPALIESLVPEAIRYQSPVMYQSRRALEDYELGGKLIRKGDKLAMWYISGNRDEDAIHDPDAFIIDRQRPRQHMSFGFGIHRCLGNRIAEMQLRVLWEEIVAQGWSRVEVMGPPTRGYNTQLRVIEALPVRIHA